MHDVSLKIQIVHICHFLSNKFKKRSVRYGRIVTTSFVLANSYPRSLLLVNLEALSFPPKSISHSRMI
jgi:hypothetical protein